MKVVLCQLFIISILLLGCGSDNNKKTDPLIAQSDTAETLQNQPVNIDVLVNDVIPMNSTLTFRTSISPVNGTVVFEANKAIYVPSNGYAGQDSFTYQITSSEGNSSQAQVVIDVVNVLPIAIDDTASLRKNAKINIDVADNDLDVEGDLVSIQSVQSSNSATVQIVNGLVEYQPMNGYTGEDSFSYTVIDSYGGTATGNVTVSISNSVLVQGKLTNFSKANVAVTIKVGTEEVSVSTNENGEYSLELDLDGLSGIVTAYANNVVEGYSLSAYLGDIAILDIDDNGIFNKNLSDVTTAEYELVNLVLGGSEAQSLTQLTSAQYEVEYDYLLDMSIAAQLIYSNNTISIPEGFSTINGFIRSIHEMSVQLAKWRTIHPENYNDAVDVFYHNPDITSLPDGLSSGDHNISGQFFSLEDEGFGTFNYTNTIISTLVWELQEYELSITLNDNLSRGLYLRKVHVEGCDEGTRTWLYLKPNQINIKKLYETNDFDVYLQKMEGEYSFPNCAQYLSDKPAFITVKKFKQKPINVNAGSFKMDTVIRDIYEPDGVRYDAVTMELNEDSSFNEYLVGGYLRRTGTWGNSNNLLMLEFNDGMSIQYDRITDEHGVANFQYVAFRNDAYLASSKSLMVDLAATVNWQLSAGVLSYAESFAFDQDNNGAGTSYQLHESGIAYRATLVNGQWQRRSESDTLYGWTLEDSIYTLTEYWQCEESREVCGNATSCNESDFYCVKEEELKFEVIKINDDGSVVNSVTSTRYERNFSDMIIFQYSDLVNIYFTPQ